MIIRLTALVAIGCAFGCALGCEQKVTEYHQRPSFYRMASESKLVDEYVDENGRRVVFIEDGPLPTERLEQQKEKQRKDELRRERYKEERLARIAAGEDVPEEEDYEPKMFRGRAELDDGTILLKAILPEHVLGHTMTCLRNGEYQLLWDQLVSRDTKMTYAERDKGIADFSEFCRKNRSELMKTLNRMIFGYYSGSDVILDRLPNLSVRVRFAVQLGQQFKFREVIVVQEIDGMKLHIIR
jgi:hypothetical protein